MGMFRGRPPCCGRARCVGRGLVALGALLLIWVVPVELWTAALGVVLIAVGCLLWKWG